MEVQEQPEDDVKVESEDEEEPNFIIPDPLYINQEATTVKREDQDTREAQLKMEVQVKHEEQLEDDVNMEIKEEEEEEEPNIIIPDPLYINQEATTIKREDQDTRELATDEDIYVSMGLHFIDEDEVKNLNATIDLEDLQKPPPAYLHPSPSSHCSATPPPAAQLPSMSSSAACMASGALTPSHCSLQCFSSPDKLTHSISTCSSVAAFSPSFAASMPFSLSSTSPHSSLHFGPLNQPHLPLCKFEAAGKGVGLPRYTANLSCPSHSIPDCDITKEPLSNADLELMALCAVACTKITTKKRTRKKKRFWVKDWLLKREKQPPSSLLNELTWKLGDWHNNLRMDEPTYRNLLSMVGPHLQKKDTCMRRSITSHERLTATLRYLATGHSYQDLKFSVAISAQSLVKIIPETCKAIWNVLQKDYMKFPGSEEEWRKIAEDFEDMWKFPNCIGAVSGKHVAITPPHDAGSFYQNYRGFHSLVLLAVVNAKSEFIMCDFGINGCTRDDRVIENTRFGEKLNNGTLQIPPASYPATSSKQSLPFVFIGDEAFPLKDSFLRPFSQGELTEERKVFNNRLSHAHSVAENAFQMLSSMFHIFHAPINLRMKNIDTLVMACCVLHNFFRHSHGNSEASDTAAEDGLGVQERDGHDSVFENLKRGRNWQFSEDAKEVREEFLKYFNVDKSLT